MQRLTPQAIAEFLGKTLIFRECPPELLLKLAPVVEQQSYPPGANLVGPGAPVHTLNFLVSGKAALASVDVSTGNRTVLEEVFPGDIYGEVGMVLGGASPWVVSADEACEALLVARGHYAKVLRVVPEVAEALTKRIANRFVKLTVLGGKRLSNSGAMSIPSSLAPPPSSMMAPPLSLSGGAMAPSVSNSVPFVDVGQFALAQQTIELVPSRLILEHRLLPLETRGRSLLVGMVNPFSLPAKEELRKVLHSLDLEVVAISADDFAQSVVRLKLDVRDRTAQFAPGAPTRIVYQVDVKKEADKQIQFMGDETVTLLDRILQEAVERGVSDVHIEPEATGVRVRFRVQGMLQDRKEAIAPTLAAPLIARLKVLSELDITDRRMPQDGRIVAQFGRRELNIRISTMPVGRGEKAVLRIIDPADVMRPLEHIFVDTRMLELVNGAISASQGAIVVAGATGSGKSSTLYSLLHQRKKVRPYNSLVTVEDPIEFLIPGVTQSHANARTGLDYATALRALMRQDPDVIMIGELRDAATARVMLEAAVTGHLVLTTTHASNVSAAFGRFEHFGADSFTMSTAMSMLIVQRLVRKLCPSCTRDADLAPNLAESLYARHLLMRGAPTKLPRAIGCDACGQTGYRGRVAVHEILSFDEATKNAVATETPSADILKAARESNVFISFAQCARMLLARKLITPAEALAATE